MPHGRPCKHDPPLPATCRLCYLWLHDVRYRKLWGGDDAAQPAPPGLWQKAVNFASAVAQHAASGFQQAGPAERERRQAICRGCTEWFDAGTGTCLHKKCGCKLNRKSAWESQRCPIGKWDVFHTHTRHLLYHIYPVEGKGSWQWNVDQLLQRWELFNGRKIIAIVTDVSTDNAHTVQEAFGDKAKDVQWIVRSNDPALREAATWEPLWSQLKECNAPGHAAFYAHAKGVTKPANRWKAVRFWTGSFHEVLLDYWPLAAIELQSKPIVGAFRRPHAVEANDGAWHYAGSFYWVRVPDFWARDGIGTMQQNWVGVESWPGKVFAMNEGGSVCQISDGLDLYNLRHWRISLEPALKTWKERNETHLWKPGLAQAPSAIPSSTAGLTTD